MIPLRLRHPYHARLRLAHVGLPLAMLVFVLLAASLFASCTSTRPVVKIGLVAPFEGLYRRTGYAALAAVRMAVEDSAAAHTAANVEIVPLALDGGADEASAQRAVRKVLADPAVRAVIGPLDPSLVAGASSPISDSGVLWLSPVQIAPAGGFLAPPMAGAPHWGTELVRTVASAASRQGAQRLVLTGRLDGWPDLTEAEWSTLVGIPVLAVGDGELTAAAADSRTAVLHLGAPDAAAAALQRMRASGGTASFWLGPAGGDPVFFERAELAETVHWVVWSDAEYNSWTQTHAPATPFDYLVYLATRQAIDVITQTPAAEGQAWRVQVFALGADGISRPVEFD